MTVWIKQGVIGDLQIPARKALGKIANQLTIDDIFVTSIREGNHSAGSLHYDGYAFDIRPINTISVEEIKDLLGPNFDVIDESTHIHIEYDPKE